MMLWLRNEDYGSVLSIVFVSDLARLVRNSFGDKEDVVGYCTHAPQKKSALTELPAAERNAKTFISHIRDSVSVNVNGIPGVCWPKLTLPEFSVSTSPASFVNSAPNNAPPPLGPTATVILNTAAQGVTARQPGNSSNSKHPPEVTSVKLRVKRVPYREYMRRFPLP